MKRNYNCPAYEQFRKDVLKRDKYHCRMPNCNNKKNLHVHHIKKWSKAYSLRYSGGGSRPWRARGHLCR